MQSTDMPCGFVLGGCQIIWHCFCRLFLLCLEVVEKFAYYYYNAISYLFFVHAPK